MPLIHRFMPLINSLIVRIGHSLVGLGSFALRGVWGGCVSWRRLLFVSKATWDALTRTRQSEGMCIRVDPASLSLPLLVRAPLLLRFRLFLHASLCEFPVRFRCQSHVVPLVLRQLQEKEARRRSRRRRMRRRSRRSKTSGRRKENRPWQRRSSKTVQNNRNP